MGRPLRTQIGGLVYHVLNRANRRALLFSAADEYRAFLVVLAEAQIEQPMRLLAYCVMPNHWHLVLWPEHDGDLSRFVSWLTLTHTQRWHAHGGTTGSGHLYQGRFKSFPVESDEHLLAVWRYVERNSVRARLVACAGDWPWSSAGQRQQEPTEGCPTLSAGPVPLPVDWTTWVDAAQTLTEEAAIRRSVRRGQPLGSADWVAQMVKDFGLQSTLRPPGHPHRRADPSQAVLFEDNGS